MTTNAPESQRADVLRFGRGEPVILLHGFCGGAEAWHPTIVHLCRRHEVIAPDWPGYGRNRDAAPLQSVAEMAAHVIALADALELPRFHVIGHSMSGFVVQQLLIDHPGRIGRAVLYGACLAMKSAGRFESAVDTADRLRREGVDATVERIAATWFVAGAADPAYPACVDAGRHMTMDAALAAMSACRDVDYTGRLGNVSSKTLVIIGERERTAPPDTALQLARELPGSSLCILPGCAHAAHLERPELFNQIVGQFLDLTD